jgi:hypothetical protein
MGLLAWIILLTAAYPLQRAWWDNRHTTLLQAVTWAVAAWVTWTGALLAAWLWPEREPWTLRYLALSLTGCAAIAVLGARRPIVTAWNFVVVGLLAVLLLPLAEGLGTPRLSVPNALFLGGTLAVGVLNYLPTRFGPVALLLAMVLGIELAAVLPPENVLENWRAALPVGQLLLALSPWVAFVLCRSQSPPASEFDRLWLAFRDRFGLVWGQRLREQFNRAAQNAGWPVYLRWGGLRLQPAATRPAVEEQEEIVAALRALLKRFGPEEASDQ